VWGGGFFLHPPRGGRGAGGPPRPAPPPPGGPPPGRTAPPATGPGDGYAFEAASGGGAPLRVSFPCPTCCQRIRVPVRGRLQARCGLCKTLLDCDT
ncbi:hypothetical protein ACFXPZ_37970, partial [Streptomyces sp. NPDC059101]